DLPRGRRGGDERTEVFGSTHGRRSEDREKDLARSGGERHLTEDPDTLPKALSIAGAHSVGHERLAGEPSADAPTGLVVDHRAEEGEVGEGANNPAMLATHAGKRRGEDARRGVDAKEGEPVTREVVAVDALHRAVPTVDALVEERTNTKRGMKREVLADLG